jgi:hypothetical protein
LLACAIAALALPYLSLRYTDRAAASYRSDPAGAARDLDRARDLNPLSIRPDLTEAAIALETLRNDDAARAYRRALDIEDNWYAHFELALLASNIGRRALAEAEMERALQLNGRDPLLKEIRRAIRRGRRLDPIEVHRRIEADTRERFHSLR